MNSEVAGPNSEIFLGIFIGVMLLEKGWGTALTHQEFAPLFLELPLTFFLSEKMRLCIINFHIFLKLQQIPFGIMNHYSEIPTPILHNLSKIKSQTKMGSRYSLSLLKLVSSRSLGVNWALDTMLNWNGIALMWGVFNARAHCWVGGVFP